MEDYYSICMITHWASYNLSTISAPPVSSQIKLLVMVCVTCRPVIAVSSYQAKNIINNKRERKKIYIYKINLFESELFQDGMHE